MPYVIFGLALELLEASSWINIHTSDAELTQHSKAESLSVVSTPRGSADGAVPAGSVPQGGGSKATSPSSSLIAEVMAPDSEEKRAEHFKKLQEIVASL